MKLLSKFRLQIRLRFHTHLRAAQGIVVAMALLARVDSFDAKLHFVPLELLTETRIRHPWVDSGALVHLLPLGLGRLQIPVGV